LRRLVARVRILGHGSDGGACANASRFAEQDSPFFSPRAANGDRTRVARRVPPRTRRPPRLDPAAPLSKKRSRIHGSNERMPMFPTKTLLTVSPLVPLPLSAAAQFTLNPPSIPGLTLTRVLPAYENHFGDYNKSIGNGWLGGSVYAYASMA